jgi:hypothetical protein
MIIQFAVSDHLNVESESDEQAAALLKPLFRTAA